MHFYRKEARFAKSRASAEPNEPSSRSRAARCGLRNDPFFLPVGAEAFKRDIPAAEVHFYDTGHFARETHAPKIASAITQFLDRATRPQNPIS